MRIVGGKFRGRQLVVPKSQNIRPTTDRNRESLFNILNHSWPTYLHDSRVLDAFAGTGALGIEALSRGAQFAMFIEQSAEGRGLLRQNIEALGLTGCTKLLRRDATRPGAVGTIRPFDLVFADPPYGKAMGEKAIAALADNGWLSPDALVVIEERKDCMPAELPRFNKIDERSSGETTIGLFRYVTST